MDDLEQIKQLKARYCRTMDTKDWTAMRQVFADDVTMDTTESGGGVVTGADEFMTFLAATLGDVVTVHQCHTPEIDVVSDESRDRRVGDGGHAALAGRHGAARLRPLPRALRAARRPLVHRVVHADTPADGLHAGGEMIE